MNSIRFDGLSTGLQTSSIIDALMDFERQPLRLIESRQRDIESQRSLFRDLNTKLLTLADAAKALDNQNSLLSGPTLDEELLAFTTSSSDEAIVTATATGDASPGSFEVRVDALAQVGRQLSQGFASATDVIAAAGETLSIDFGGAAPIEITVGAGGASLSDLRDLVNGHAENDGRVQADVLFDGTAHRLVLSGTETGASNDLLVTTDLSGPGGAGSFLDAALGQAASDAQIQVLGVAVTRDSNVIDDLFGGITLELHSAHDAAAPAERTTIDVARDDEAISEKLQAVVDAFNTVRQFASDQSQYDEATGTAGPLSGNSTLRSIDQQVQTIVGSAYAFADNPFSSLGQIGIRFDREGQLTLDEDVLRSALDEDTASVRQLLSGDGTTDGAATALARALEGITRTGDGTLANADDGFEARIDALDRSIERFEQRLEQREALLVQRFSRLESLISSLQAQGGSIASALVGS